MFLKSTQTPTTTPIITQATIQPDCAWCLSEAGLPQGEGSHGACGRHLTALYSEADRIQEERAARRAQKGR